MAPPICGVVISLLCVVVMMSQPLLVDSYSNEYSFTFKLPPGKEQCFYEDMKEGESLELEYQVNRHFYCITFPSLSLPPSLSLSPSPSLFIRLSKEVN
jgi:hypothetical protein